MKPVENLYAPDEKVLLADGSHRHLSEFWQARKLVLVFLRHLGWPFCREQVAQLRRSKERFDAADARVLLVGMGSEAETRAFIKKLSVPYEMVCDPEQQLYSAFNLKRMSLLDALKPKVALRGMSALAKGHHVGVPHGDMRQLPGVFIINTDGRVAYAHYAKDPADHPVPQEILKLL